MPRKKEMEIHPGDVVDVLEVTTNGMITIKQNLCEYLQIDEQGWVSTYAASARGKVIISKMEELDG